ncbi:hypothetical protein ULMS_26030 [Patiriisocius marinistellae]|uniref:N-acetyltransferase domain-containing protein n=1 Tax=Patiriisocius marinistellae TaxID=2494560 RepID=A0A5J4G326_9FLAO|nr:GNAT family N-acetyltransferase [Patiriisocius marinistellae]GEQ87095.1 hypothetical protein ULMS_26030 [Patiriisocius marinistellae]
MTANFSIIPPSEILKIIPLLGVIGDHKVPEAILKERVLEMSIQNYECIAITYEEKLIGICGMWFQTRHYAGKSVEIDHVVIEENFRGKKIGDQLMQFIYGYAASKKCRWVELNTYVHNFPSHKFYYNQGFVAKGYHFVKEL